MIRTVAFVPATPVLIPAVSGRGHADVADVAAACVTALAQAVAGADTVLLLGPADDPAHRSAAFVGDTRGTLRGLGAALDVTLDGSVGSSPAPALPLAHTVGAWLLQAAQMPTALVERAPVTAYAVGADWPASPARTAAADAATAARRAALVVVGDGSARRTVKAPGYLDDRAARFDAGVVAALRTGDASALADLDPALGAALLAAGVPAWRAAGDLLGATNRTTGGAVDWDAELLAERDPFGVAYLVARWTARG